jgi:23S rRNA (uracil1939-C5)-methyltransferase
LATIEKLVYGGDGLARDDGRVTFVPYSLPGEVWEEGKLATPSPLRIEPRCPVFTRCGGCHYQHFDYAEQVRQKQAILSETLARLGRIEAPEMASIAGDAWGYRNRVQLHRDGRLLGFHATRSNQVVDIESCPIASPAINQAIGVLRAKLPTFVRSIELFTNEQETLVSIIESGKPLRKSFFGELARQIAGADRSSLDYRVGEDVFRVSYRAFFQVNRFLIGPLVDAAIAAAGSGSAWDLYAGVGLMSIPLARRLARVTAVEVVNSAAHDLEFNAQRSGARLDAVRSSTEDFLAAQTEAPEFVLADPPRAGLGKRVTDHLLRLLPERLTIVSCDPSTLARDLAQLSRSYRLEKITLVDLFPQTFHIESVAELVRS